VAATIEQYRQAEREYFSVFGDMGVGIDCIDALGAKLLQLWGDLSPEDQRRLDTTEGTGMNENPQNPYIGTPLPDTSNPSVVPAWSKPLPEIPSPRRVPMTYGWICPNCGASVSPHTPTCPMCAPPMRITC
jgi:hypothetical protein